MIIEDLGNSFSKKQFKEWVCIDRIEDLNAYLRNSLTGGYIMEKDKRVNKVIHGDNFVMYNDVIIPSSPEQQFMNEDLQSIENKEQEKKDKKINNRVDSYYDGLK